MKINAADLRLAKKILKGQNIRKSSSLSGKGYSGWDFKVTPGTYLDELGVTRIYTYKFVRGRRFLCMEFGSGKIFIHTDIMSKDGIECLRQIFPRKKR